MQVIEHKGDVFGMILRSDYQMSEGIKFFTKETAEFQMGFMNRPFGYSVKPHLHISQQREINNTSEVLIVRRGSLRVTFYIDASAVLVREVLRAGDICMFVKGGHGVEFLEDSHVVEIKQGPHIEGQDKIFI